MRMDVQMFRRVEKRAFCLYGEGTETDDPTVLMTVFTIVTFYNYSRRGSNKAKELVKGRPLRKSQVFFTLGCCFCYYNGSG